MQMGTLHAEPQWNFDSVSIFCHLYPRASWKGQLFFGEYVVCTSLINNLSGILLCWCQATAGPGLQQPEVDVTKVYISKSKDFLDVVDMDWCSSSVMK